MKPILQTMTGLQGNCLNAAVASILEISIADTPDTSRLNTEGQWGAWAHWGFNRNIQFLKLKDVGASPAGYTVAIVPTDLGPSITHCIVAKDGHQVHDPAPYGRKYERPYLAWLVMAPIDPSKPFLLPPS